MWNFLKSKTEKKASALVKKGFNLNSNQGRSLLTNSIELISKLNLLYEEHRIKTEREEDTSRLTARILEKEKSLLANLKIFLSESFTHEDINHKKQRQRISQKLQSLRSIAFKA